MKKYWSMTTAQGAKTYQFTGADGTPPDVHIELYLYTVQRRADDVLVQ